MLLKGSVSCAHAGALIPPEVLIVVTQASCGLGVWEPNTHPAPVISDPCFVVIVVSLVVAVTSQTSRWRVLIGTVHSVVPLITGNSEVSGTC